MRKQQTVWEIASERVPTSVAEVLDILLENRGLERSALECRLEDLQPHAERIRNLDAAADLLARAVRDGRRVVVVGDYDCDGLTSTAQLALFLRGVGVRDFVAATPASRAEGYGLPLGIVRAHREADLFVTLDCGTHDHEAVRAAREQGAQVVVIDHHAIPDPSSIAPATVLVNPWHPECPSTFKEFATAGLTLLFLSRLRRVLPQNAGDAARPAIQGDFLALAAVGTVADVMPLVGPNRVLVRHGLDLLSRGRPAPLQALREVAGLAGRALDAGHIGFQIAPRLNAAARMEDAGLALALLLAEDRAEILRLARELDALNRRRQQQVEELFTAMRLGLAEMEERRTVVLADPVYPMGVNGILAQRVAREVHRPAIVLQAFPDEGIATGSARSIPGFDLFGALRECAELLERWGGHAMAAGLTLRLENLEAFRRRLEAVAQGRDASVFVPRERADLELPASLVTKRLLDALRELGPHGLGNPAPRFALRGCEIVSLRAFGREPAPAHLEIGLDNGLDAVLWSGAARFEHEIGEAIDLACGLDWNEYRGRPQAVVRDAGTNLFGTHSTGEGEGLAAQGFEPRTRG